MLFAYTTTYILILFFFFFNDTATTEIYTLSLHDALPISRRRPGREPPGAAARRAHGRAGGIPAVREQPAFDRPQDRKSTRLNSSHANISYAVFCLKKKKKKKTNITHTKMLRETQTTCNCE